MAATPTKVFPVPGTFLVGEPATVHEVESRERAKELFATGHFAPSQSEADALSPLSKEAISELRSAERADDDEAAAIAAQEDKADIQPPAHEE